MHSESNTADSLRRVFYEGFSAQDVAEPLASFDLRASLDEVRSFMVDRPLTVIGLREHGVISHFLYQHDLDDRALVEQARPITACTVVPTSTALHTVVAKLNEEEFVLVSSLGQPGGVIVRSDFEKPPTRMWLFGMVTLFELSLTRIVSDHYQNDSWREFVSPPRVEKALRLREERERRNQSVRLIDCLQLGDKGQLLARSDQLRNRFWDESKKRIKRGLKEMESLRNNLAHSQPLVTENWDIIVRIASTLDRFLEIPAELIAPSSLRPYNPEPASDVVDTSE